MMQRIILSLLVVFTSSSSAMQRSASESNLAPSAGSLIKLKDKKKTKISPTRDAFLRRLSMPAAATLVQSHGVLLETTSTEERINISDADFINLIQKNSSHSLSVSAIRLRVKEIYATLRLSTCTLDNLQKKWIVSKFAELYPHESPKSKLMKAKSLSASVGDMRSMPKEDEVKQALDFLSEEEKTVEQSVNELTPGNEYTLPSSQTADLSGSEQSSATSSPTVSSNPESLSASVGDVPSMPEEDTVKQVNVLTQSGEYTLLDSQTADLSEIDKSSTMSSEKAEAVTASLDRSPCDTLNSDLLRKSDLSHLEEKLSQLPTGKKTKKAFLSPRRCLTIGAFTVLSGLVIREFIKYRDNKKDTNTYEPNAQ